MKQKNVLLGENAEKLVAIAFSLYTFLGRFRMFRKFIKDFGGHLRAWQVKEDTYTPSSHSECFGFVHVVSHNNCVKLSRQLQSIKDFSPFVFPLL